MKKLILTIIGFVLLCFAIPMIFTKKYNNQEKIAEVLEENKEYDYKQYNNMKLLHANTGVIEEIPLDEYLYGVVSADDGFHCRSPRPTCRGSWSSFSRNASKF